MPILRRLLLVPAIVLLAACADDGPPTAPPAVSQAAPRALTISYRCDVDARSGSMRCNPPSSRPDGVAADIIVGGGYVVLASSNVAYNSNNGLYTFDVTVENRIPQPIGTTDGTTTDPSGIRVFFHSGPTVTSGSGTVAVVPDGYATFSASSQPFYRYTTVLDSGEVSAAKTWTLVVQPTVVTFSFNLLVSVPVQYPSGWVTVTLAPVAIMDGGDPAIALALVRSAVGTVITSGTVSWASGDPAAATVTSIDARRAEVYGVSPGFSFITGSFPSRAPGSAEIEVY